MIETFRTSEGRDWLIKAETRYNKLVPASWFAANLMHPEYGGLTLSPSELKLAMEWLENEYPDAYPEVIKYVGGDRDIIQGNWKKAKRAKVANFMKVQATLGNVGKELCEIACLHYVLVPSSAEKEEFPAQWDSCTRICETNFPLKKSRNWPFVQFRLLNSKK